MLKTFLGNFLILDRSSLFHEGNVFLMYFAEHDTQKLILSDFSRAQTFDASCVNRIDVTIGIFDSFSLYIRPYPLKFASYIERSLTIY